MEKKLDEQKEIKLKPVAETEHSSGASSPELVAVSDHVAASDGVVESAIDESRKCAEPVESVILESESHSEADIKDGAHLRNGAVEAGASAKLNRNFGSRAEAPEHLSGVKPPNKSFRLSRSTFRKTCALIAFSAAFVAVNNGLKSLWSSPLAAQLTIFGGASVFSAWCGDSDAAYALQEFPVMIDDLSDYSGGGRKMISPERRAAVIASLNRFVKSSGTGSHELSKFAHAVVMASNGKPLEAAHLLSDLKAENPLVSGLLASTLAMVGDYSAALEECNRGIEIISQSKGRFDSTMCEGLWDVKAQILTAMGRPEAALTVLELPQFPEFFKEPALKRDSIKSMQASNYLKLGQADKAIVTLCQSSTLNHVLLSAAYLQKGDIAEAKQQAGDSRLALSRIYSQTGDLDKALQYAKAADDAKFGLHAREQHVYVLNQMGRYREALALCNDLTEFEKLKYLSEIFESMPQLNADMAWSYARLGRSKEALALAESVLKINPSNRVALEAAKLASHLTGNVAGYEEFDKRLKYLNPYLLDRPTLFYDDMHRKKV